MEFVGRVIDLINCMVRFVEHHSTCDAAELAARVGGVG